jgi:DNA-binding HxlR family transcriptional regulator
MSGDDDQHTTRGEEGGPGPCSLVRPIQQIGSEWRLIVLYELLEGEMRFNELKRSSGANPRTLSRVLNDLRERGFVKRRLEEDAPVASYYRLTPKGASLAPVFEAIEGWSEEWLEEPVPAEAD